MKNENKFTPGPWSVMPERDWIVVMPENCDIGHGKKYVACGGGNKEVNNANARLIAAAPELLAALESIEKRLNSKACDRNPDALFCWQISRAAIAKAKGETNV